MPLLLQRFRAVLPWLLAWALCGAFGPAWGQGTTVAIGGALRDSNDEVWQRLVQLAGGPGARFAVFATAAGDPDRSAAQIAAVLQRHGAVAEHIRVAPRLSGQDLAQAVQDPVWIAKVRASKAVFFSGGAQARLLDTLQPGGRRSPLLQAVHEVWAAGGLVAGTSSGAAVLGEVVFRDAPDVLAVMKGRLREGQEVDRGFAFLPPQLAVDQHFVRRGRIGRLLPLMQSRGLALGIGVEEDSAVIVRGNEVEVIGASGAVVVDLNGAKSKLQLGAFNLQDACLHWLQSGDRFRLDSRSVQAAPHKQAGQLLDPNAPGFRGYHEGDAFVLDILAEGALPRAMARLIDGDRLELLGLAFAARPAADDPAPGLGFEWRLRVGTGTRGWLAAGGGEAYTLEGVRLDIVPVRMALPLYLPFTPFTPVSPTPP